jgi:hypothetical protein
MRPQRGLVTRIAWRRIGMFLGFLALLAVANGLISMVR